MLNFAVHRSGFIQCKCFTEKKAFFRELIIQILLNLLTANYLKLRYTVSSDKASLLIMKISTFNSFMTEAVIIYKPVHWFQWTGFYMITASVMKELSVVLVCLLFLTLNEIWHRKNPTHFLFSALTLWTVNRLLSIYKDLILLLEFVCIRWVKNVKNQRKKQILDVGGRVHNDNENKNYIITFMFT